MIASLTCLITRRRMADYLAADRQGLAADRQGLSGGQESAARRRVERHIASCARCARMSEAHRSVIDLLGEASRIDLPPRLESRLAAFEQRVLAAARERGTATRATSLFPVPLWSRPVPAAAAVAAGVLVVAGAIALSVSGFLGPSQPGVGPERIAAGLAGEASEAILFDDSESAPADWVRSPQEIPVVVYEDLVGGHRARIPSVTYVMEPAPRHEGVIRASF
jgi:hypothetical protein